ncbi:MAG: hypothetical protein LC797_13555 [Chloroflexi bacterium]|nr:hypothetical protein [Chloroflexota bacterium]
MINNLTAKGKRTAAKILAELVASGRTVLIPWGEERYELALDEDGRLVRIQCKTGTLRDGCVDFKTCIMDIRRALGDGGYRGQIEAFAVYCPQADKAYLVPIDAVPGPTRNCQITGVRWARDYELTAERLGLLGAQGPLAREASTTASLPER